MSGDLHRAVACTTEKSTSGQKVDSIREHQSKLLVSAGKHKEKPDTTKDVVSERVVVENNLLGGNEDTQTKFVQEHGKDIASCSTNPGGAECKRGEAVNKAIAAALVGGATGGVVIALTPEAIAAAQAAVSACGANTVLCANEVSIWVAEMVAGDALPAGLTVAAVGKMSASELSELKALMAVEKQTGQKISAESLEKLMLDSGGKGNWSKELNNPQPNKVYHVDGDKIYKTDAQAGPSQVEATLSPNVKDRNGYQQCKAGKCGLDGDEGGHFIASIFNGPGEKLNHCSNGWKSEQRSLEADGKYLGKSIG